MAKAFTERALVDLPHADPMTKIATLAKLPFLLREGHNECLQIMNLRVGITKLGDGTHIVSATWQSAGGGHWCGPTGLKVEFCRLGLALGSVNLGNWQADCGQVNSYSSNNNLVPANYFGEAHQLAVPEHDIVTSEC
jgi:hypothetical protein